MLIEYNEKKVKISGELTFQPLVFYGDIIAFKNWDIPFESEKITEEEKNEIINFITEDSKNNQTKIIFD